MYAYVCVCLNVTVWLQIEEFHQYNFLLYTVIVIVMNFKKIYKSPTSSYELNQRQVNLVDPNPVTKQRMIDILEPV